MINLTLINDNIPVIVINTTDTSCLAVPPVNALQKRDVSAVASSSAKFHRRRLQLKRKSAKGKLHVSLRLILLLWVNYSKIGKSFQLFLIIFRPQKFCQHMLNILNLRSVLPTSLLSSTQTQAHLQWKYKETWRISSSWNHPVYMPYPTMAGGATTGPW